MSRHVDYLASYPGRPRAGGRAPRARPGSRARSRPPLAILLAAAACCSGVGTHHARAPTSETVNRLDARVDSAVRAAMAARNIPGVAVAVLRRDTVVLLRGYGVAHRERRTPVTPQTVFQIASTTKPFTAMAVMLLVEEGKIDLDAPAARYLSWLPVRYSAVTVRQLLNHTSGVAPDMRRANVDEFSEAEFRARFAERPASFPAGASWQYANAGYTLLSQIVEAVSGQPFGTFLERRLFAPLGMRHTAYRVAQHNDDRHAVGYDWVGGTVQRAPHVFSGWGNSGIESTAADLARWVAAITRGEVLRPSSYRMMLTPGRVLGDTAANFQFRDSRSGYGFGWFLTTFRGEELVTHGGAIAGFSSVVHRFPARGWSVVVLSNGKQGADRQNQADVVAQAVIEAVGIVGPAERGAGPAPHE